MDNMILRSIARSLSLFVILTLSFATDLAAQSPSVASIKALHEYAEKNGVSPKDYIFKLFEKSDIVVLGERDHRDSVQYNFILDLLADYRFAERVGHVYTEVGGINLTEDVNRLLQGSYSSENEFMDSLYTYYRKGECFYPLWEKYNRIKFLKGLHDINKKSSRKIHLGLTDLDFSWENIRTVEDYKAFWTSLNKTNRDSLMCANFTGMYERQTPIAGVRKALVITSQPHAINYSGYFKYWNRDYGTQGWWMKKTFGNDRVKIVILNWFDYVLFNGQNYPMTGNGSWDAAFDRMDCRPFGIDLHNSPYGETSYNGDGGGGPTLIKGMKWQDVADGLIYDAPLYDHVAAIGIKGIISKEFEPEIKRRAELFWRVVHPKDTVVPFDAFIKEYNIPLTAPATFKSKEEIKRLIQAVEAQQQD
ncbi:hypothetical protein [Bacteroides caecimuris]|uniref:hypothetical protein n=1 Tax=Bacteroides caecimuris TaxID=1796613 RepID=UPI0020CEE6CF|nr:hypothetical protein [Bacteroides caecimuris]